MNMYDVAAIAAIQDYHTKHGKYPPCVEATAEYIEMMGYYYFEFPDPADANTVIRVPVVEIGTGDIVFRRQLVRNLGNTFEEAECATKEEFHLLGAKLDRAGLIIFGEKSRWGLQLSNPQYFFHQIEAFVFGEETELEEVLADRLHEE